MTRNSTGIAPARDTHAGNLLDGFAVALARHPDRVAVTDGERRMTYAELDRAVTELATAVRARLRGRPDPEVAQPQPHVAILLPRCIEMVTAAVAALRAGASYIPLDPAAPPGRLRMIVDDAQPGLVVTTIALADQLPTGTPRLLVDDWTRLRHMMHGVDRSHRVPMRPGGQVRPQGMLTDRHSHGGPWCLRKPAR